MKHTQTFTHAGWFGICPVYLADLGTDCPHLTPRVDNAFFEGLFLVSHWAFVLVFVAIEGLAALVGADLDLGFPIFVTRELEEPHRYEYDDDEELML